MHKYALLGHFSKLFLVPDTQLPQHPVLPQRQSAHSILTEPRAHGGLLPLKLYFSVFPVCTLRRQKTWSLNVSLACFFAQLISAEKVILQLEEERDHLQKTYVLFYISLTLLYMFSFTIN